MNYVYECKTNNYREPYCNCWQPSVQVPGRNSVKLDKDPNVIKEMITIFEKALYLVKKDSI
jgi:hypothetical protein